jgi:hypothetical protein
MVFVSLTFVGGLVLMACSSRLRRRPQSRLLGLPGPFWRARIAPASDGVAMSGPLPAKAPVLPDMKRSPLVVSGRLHHIFFPGM